MPNRRYLSLWFPRLEAERALRLQRGLTDRPLVVVGTRGNTQVLTSLTEAASAMGLRRGQGLQDARAICPDLLTRPETLQDAQIFLTVLRRWAGKFSPWVAEEPPEGLIIDLTGCAHLFGGEDALIAQAEQDCADQRLSVRLGLADTPGTAWALARYSGASVDAMRSGDDIDQEARATRSRAVKRRNWERGGAPPTPRLAQVSAGRVAPPGQVHGMLAPLPVAALRLDGATIEGLARVGLRRIGDLTGQPRAALARRYGRLLVRRLDQALGVEPEPITPARAPLHFATRLSFPDPIGLEDDILAGLDRILEPLCARLADKGRGARRLRLELYRAGGGVEALEIGLARPGRDPLAIRRLLAMKISGLEAGFGFDMIRLQAHVTEPLSPRQHRGGLSVGEAGGHAAGTMDAEAALIERLGTRVGLDAITRYRPASSHIPEKTDLVVGAAWETAHDGPWPAPHGPRPLTLFRPEPVTCDPPDSPRLPARFRWRGRNWQTVSGTGPERIAPEWWLDDPLWRTGPRDYWRVDTAEGARLWLYFAHGGALSAGWFCQGDFG